MIKVGTEKAIGDFLLQITVGRGNDADTDLDLPIAAAALADAFDCEVNDLPLSLVVSWFEQKAAAVLLTLLALGIRNIRLGPTLPAFLTPNLVQALVDRFKILPITTAQADIDAALAPKAT